MNTIATRTYNPLPFEHLEPKRFEDLVRQLVYDFRNWRRLEATGRSGSDDGFDARAMEIVDVIAEYVDDDAPRDADSWLDDRLWLVQCKREKQIGPTKLKNYLAEIVLTPDERLYGLIFVAACDFSKKSRDELLDWCRENGIDEAYIWGKGELEDLLFQPKNDHLLFAYFGFSLQIRRRNQATVLRSEIATKRKLKRHLLQNSCSVLVRDPNAVGYPERPISEPHAMWCVYRVHEMTHEGLILEIGRNYAYIDPLTGAWDSAEAVRAVPMRVGENPWHVRNESDEALRATAREFWENIDEDNKGWTKIFGVIKLNSIIAIDELGDDIFSGVHLYAPFTARSGPFSGIYWHVEQATAHNSQTWSPENDKRVLKFPIELRKEK